VSCIVFIDQFIPEENMEWYFFIAFSNFPRNKIVSLLFVMDFAMVLELIENSTFCIPVYLLVSLFEIEHYQLFTKEKKTTSFASFSM
jgi:hypothetical protein